MCVQNSNFKISAHPDLATNLLQILIPATFNNLSVLKRANYTSAIHVLEGGLLKTYLVITPNLHRNFCLFKQELFS